MLCRVTSGLRTCGTSLHHLASPYECVAWVWDTMVVEKVRETKLPYFPCTLLGLAQRNSAGLRHQWWRIIHGKPSWIHKIYQWLSSGVWTVWGLGNSLLADGRSNLWSKRANWALAALSFSRSMHQQKSWLAHNARCQHCLRVWNLWLTTLESHLKRWCP